MFPPQATQSLSCCSALGPLPSSLQRVGPAGEEPPLHRVGQWSGPVLQQPESRAWHTGWPTEDAGPRVPQPPGRHWLSGHLSCRLPFKHRSHTVFCNWPVTTLPGLSSWDMGSVDPLCLQTLTIPVHTLIPVSHGCGWGWMLPSARSPCHLS